MDKLFLRKSFIKTKNLTPIKIVIGRTLKNRTKTGYFCRYKTTNVVDGILAFANNFEIALLEKMWCKAA